MDAPRRKLTPPEGSAPEQETTAAPSQSGETVTAAEATEVTWRAADGPRVISGNYVIPAGTTVTVEPGVVIQINQNSALVVEGAIVGRGTADRRIRITGFPDYSSDIQVPGRFEFEYTDISAQSDPRSGGTYTCSNCRYTGSSGFYMALGYSYTMPPYIELNHATFDGRAAGVSIDNATAVLRDVAFVNGAYGRIFYSYVYLDNVRSDNTVEFGLQLRLDGRWYLNNLQLRNSAGPALDLGGGNRGGDFHLGPDVTLAGSKFPVNLESAGLLPGSTLPTSGNTNNYIVADTPAYPDWRGPFTWAPQAIPYVVLSSINLRGGEWRILPGTNVKFGPGFSGITDESLGLIARGLPGAPILFDRFDPAQSWGHIGNTAGGNRYAHIRLEGSKNGINTTVHNGAYAYVEDLILSNNEIGAAGGVLVEGTRFYNNNTGYQETGTGSHTAGVLNAGPSSPNSFEGNGVAVRATESVIEARGNWWNSPTGPRHPSNPGGTGEIIEGASEFIPFLTTRPDYTDTPPVVRQHKPHFTYDPGTKINITWDAEDDRSIVSHRILFNPDGNASVGFQTIAEGLPGSARAYSWTVPPAGYAIMYGYSSVRVVSIDSAGHERFDDRFIQIPSGDMTGSLRITSDLAGMNLRPGQRFDVTFVAEGDARNHVLDAFLLLDNDAYTISLGGVAGSLGTLPIAKIPHNISTDRARLAFRANGGRNRVMWFYGEYFSIRPDPRVGDAAPTVSVVSPSPGGTFLAGGPVRVSWSAFDDEGVRSFSVLASYDAGRSWHLVAEGLPATATSYDLPTAPGAGFADVRARVVATDRRFQQSSGETSFALTSTAPPNAPPAVSLQRPTADSAYVAGATLTVTAEASDADGSISQVEFFAGTTLLGTDAAAPYEIAWQNVPAGTHSLIARATDNSGAKKDSRAVNVTVHAEPPASSAFPGATWGARYNGPSNGGDVASIMALDASGNVHLTASSYGVGSSQDIVTIKYDSAGRQLWAARYGNPDNRVEYSEDIALDAQGNVYVTGTAWRGNDFDGGTGYDFITIKYDSNGNQQWVRFYTGTSDAYGRSLEPDAAGNVYVTGSSYFTRADGNPANQFVTLKYDPSGNLLWTRAYTGPEGRGAAPVDLKLDAAGNIYLGGVVAVLGTNGATDNNLAVVKYDATGSLLRAAQYDTPGTNQQDFDNAVRLRVVAGAVFLIGDSWPDQCCEVTAARYDSVLVKFNSELALQWAARWGQPGQSDEGPNDLTSDEAGNVYVVGTSGSVSRAGDAFTLKYDAAGKLLWQRIYEGSTYKSADTVGVVLDPSGGVQVGVGAIGPADNYDYTLVRYLADGTQSGVRQFNGPANLDDILDDIEADAAGNIYLTGVTFTNTSGADLFTLKIAPAGAPTPTPAPTPGPNTSLTNYALATNGGVATASSTTTQAELPGMDFSPAGVINGDRKGLNWERGGGWRDATNNAFPDWVQVD
ncbi:MAG: SBBP repeat-containing protein, partial [Acidobacteria bacterium]|nr:SBBP repeat-containing protein [Acidobacteriota bacterium]